MTFLVPIILWQVSMSVTNLVSRNAENLYKIGKALSAYYIWVQFKVLTKN